MGPATAVSSRDTGTAELRLDVEQFLARCRQPAFLETGETLFPLAPGCYTFEEQSGRLVFHVWDQTRSLARRVTGLASQARGRITLRVEHFGKRHGEITLLDLAAPTNHATSQRSGRHAFAERFRVFLHRQFAGFRIAELSSDADLEHSLSPTYPRALLRKGTQAWAAIGAPPDALDIDGVLTFGLIWLDYLRRNREMPIEGLAVFVPRGGERTTCLRLRFLDESLARYRSFVYSEDAGEIEVDLRDYGNLDTHLLEAHREDPSQNARTAFRRGPEFHLEARVRAHVETIDARLLPAPVYGQVPAIAGGCHGVMDLLAVERNGRLAVLELKASEDIHLPLQALDYWMRVQWHLQRGEFTSRGYFPGIELRTDAPRLLLVAPSLDFHPANEIVLRYFSRAIEVRRIGLGVEWQKRVRVMFRM